MIAGIRSEYRIGKERRKTEEESLMLRLTFVRCYEDMRRANIAVEL